MKGFIGAANIDTNSRLCMSSAVTGYKRAFGADVVPCSSTMMWKTAIWWCWSARTPPGRIRCCSSGWRRRSGIIPDCGSWRSTPRRTATCEIADRHLALAPEATAGCLWGCLTPWLEAGASRRWLSRRPVQALAAARGWDVARVAAFRGLPADEVAGFYREFIAPRGRSPPLHHGNQSIRQRQRQM